MHGRQGKQCTIKGKSFKFTIHLHCLDSSKYGKFLWSPCNTCNCLKHHAKLNFCPSYFLTRLQLRNQETIVGNSDGKPYMDNRFSRKCQFLFSAKSKVLQWGQIAVACARQSMMMPWCPWLMLPANSQTTFGMLVILIRYKQLCLSTKRWRFEVCSGADSSEAGTYWDWSWSQLCFQTHMKPSCVFVLKSFDSSIKSAGALWSQPWNTARVSKAAFVCARRTVHSTKITWFATSAPKVHLWTKTAELQSHKHYQCVFLSSKIDAWHVMIGVVQKSTDWTCRMSFPSKLTVYYCYRSRQFQLGWSFHRRSSMFESHLLCCPCCNSLHSAPEGTGFAGWRTVMGLYV